MYYEMLSDMEQCLLCIVIMFLAFVTLHRMLQTIWFHMPVKYILFSGCVFGISLIYFEGGMRCHRTHIGSGEGRVDGADIYEYTCSVTGIIHRHTIRN